MRGSASGALNRSYLHSAITEVLWRDVAETEILFSAKLAHAGMLASLYGNPASKLEDGNDQIHEMYVAALNSLPYIHATTQRKRGETDELVDEWKRANAEIARQKAVTEEDGDVRG